jgi:hypothetical protein
MEPEAFISALAATYSDLGYSIRDFIKRDNWADEEILVPGKVPPSYILGYCSNGAWHPWEVPSAREVGERLNVLIALWATTTRK